MSSGAGFEPATFGLLSPTSSSLVAGAGSIQAGRGRGTAMADDVNGQTAAFCGV
jgi:hypothetical protein